MSFFRSPRRSFTESDVADQRRPSARGFDSPDGERPLRVMYEDAGRTGAPVEAEAVAEPMVRVPVLSGVVAAKSVEADELDIPAFLRRGQ